MIGYKNPVRFCRPAESRFAYKGRVWVSMVDFVVVRILGSPARTPPG
jgi:hypothetical protein